MANICITSICNRGCSYCFAQGNSSKPDYMSLNLFQRSLSFIKRSNIDKVRLLGGEPTLHPQFGEILRLSRETGKSILLFTNGLIHEKELNLLLQIPTDKINVLINITQLPTEENEVFTRQRRTIEHLGKRISLGINIFRPEIHQDFIFDIFQGIEINKSLRVGLALPRLGSENVWLHPRQYPFVGMRIARLAEMAAKQGVHLSFDCGFVPCMFSKETLSLLRSTKADLGWRCNPILDIDTAGNIIHCFPLEGLFSARLDEEIDAKTLRTQFIKKTRLFSKVGIYTDCSECDLKHIGECPGGCLAVRAKRFQNYQDLELKNNDS